MRPLSLILAAGFLLASLTMAGSQPSRLPGIGTFSYNGSPIGASHPVIIAAR